jgi:hypothetical protein
VLGAGVFQRSGPEQTLAFGRLPGVRRSDHPLDPLQVAEGGGIEALVGGVAEDLQDGLGLGGGERLVGWRLVGGGRGRLARAMGLLAAALAAGEKPERSDDRGGGRQGPDDGPWPPIIC